MKNANNQLIFPWILNGQGGVGGGPCSGKSPKQLIFWATFLCGTGKTRIGWKTSLLRASLYGAYKRQPTGPCMPNNMFWILKALWTIQRKKLVVFNVYMSHFLNIQMPEFWRISSGTFLMHWISWPTVHFASFHLNQSWILLIVYSANL